MSDITVGEGGPAGGNETLYTYIGISEPERARSMNFYENDSVVSDHKKNMDFDAEQHEKM